MLGTPGSQIEVLQGVPGGPDSVPYVRITGAYEAAAYERSVRDDPRIAAFTAIQRSFQMGLYRIKWDQAVNGLISSIHEHDLLIEQAIGRAQHWTLQLRGPDRAAIEAVRHDCQTEDIPITALTIRDQTDGDTGAPYNLTTKQRKAVRLAFERGYFRVPRETSLTELAEELGISRQSFTRRLHRGLQGILDALLDHSDNQQD